MSRLPGTRLRKLGNRVCILLVFAWPLGDEAIASTPPSDLRSAPDAEQIALQHAQPAKMRGLTLSPSGKRLAMVLASANGKRVAAVLDLPIQGDPRVVGGYADANVTRVMWVNDDRLVYEAYEPGAEIQYAATMAVDHDGNNDRPLIVWADSQSPNSRVLPYGWTVVGAVGNNSPEVYVKEQSFRGNGDFIQSRLSRLNTRTGELTIMSLGAPDYASYQVVDTQGQLRVVLTTHNGRSRLHARQSDGSWAVLEDHDSLSDDIVYPLYLERDGTLIVNTRRNHDTAGLHAYDFQKRRLDPEPLVRLSRFDVSHRIEVDSKSGLLVGTHLWTDAPQSVWFTDRMVAIQKAVDAALPPGRFNRISCGHCESSTRYLVFSSSDQQPGEYHLYDHDQRQLMRVGVVHPQLVEREQGRRSFHRIAARDGLSLPLVLTHPPGIDQARPIPAVVLVHGGPWVRGHSREWDSEAQFLARRGWRVIQVDFRGSDGLGSRHFRAGLRQWGLAMQDDLADAVQWAAREGWIDSNRVCIAGSSYGGYAALMGPIRHPDLYRCAASHAGVTDLRLMFTSQRSDINDQSRRFSYTKLIGDPKSDAEMLASNSPVNRVADIRVPVLLAHGTLDRRVPREHANAFETAALKAGVKLKRLSYNREGHGWFFVESEVDFLKQLDAFIASAIGRAN